MLTLVKRKRDKAEAYKFRSEFGNSGGREWGRSGIISSCEVTVSQTKEALLPPSLFPRGLGKKRTPTLCDIMILVEIKKKGRVRAGGQGRRGTLQLGKQMLWGSQTMRENR